jgi:hypothetical protein
MANTDVNKYPYTGQAEQNPYGGVSLENLAAVISALLPKGGNNSSGQNIYAGVSPAGLAEVVGLGNIQSNNSPAANIYGGVSFEGLLNALRPNPSASPAVTEGSSLVSQIPTDTSTVSIPVPEIANNVIDPSQLMRIEKGSYGPASTETQVRQPEGTSPSGKVQKQPDQYQYSGK